MNKKIKVRQSSSQLENISCFITNPDLLLTKQTSSCRKVKLEPIGDMTNERIETAKLQSLISSCKSIDTKGKTAKFGRNSSLLSVSRKRTHDCCSSLDVLQIDEEKNSHGYKI